MKKILFATTALVATAGAASAEIALTGSAEIGILGGAAYGDVTQFHTDIDVTFTMTGEADNGLTFGAAVDLDENGAFGNTTQGGETYFVAYGGARLDMGDVDGAFDAAMTEVNVAAGSIDDSETAHVGFNGNAGLDGNYDGQIATFSYAASGFTGYLSTEIDDAGAFDPVWGVGFKYTGDLGGTALTVGLGYQSGDSMNADMTATAPFQAITDTVAGADGLVGTADDDVAAGAAFAASLATDLSFVVSTVSSNEREEAMGIAVKATLSSGISVGLNYSEATYGDVFAFNPGADGVAGTADDAVISINSETETHWGLGVGYTVNALAIGLNYGEYDNRYGVDGLETKGYGLAATYDLGGGLSARAGYGNSTTSLAGYNDVDSDSFSLGLAMSF